MKPEGERIVTLEVQMTQVTLTVNRIEDKLDKFIEKADTNYVTKKELEEVRAETVARATEIKEIATKKVWTTSFLTGLFTAIVTTVVLYVLQQAIK